MIDANVSIYSLYEYEDSLIFIYKISHLVLYLLKF